MVCSLGQTCDLHLTMFNALKYRHINAVSTIFYSYINVAINNHIDKLYESKQTHTNK